MLCPQQKRKKQKEQAEYMVDNRWPVFWLYFFKNHNEEFITVAERYNF